MKTEKKIKEEKEMQLKKKKLEPSGQATKVVKQEKKKEDPQKKDDITCLYSSVTQTTMTC